MVYGILNKSDGYFFVTIFFYPNNTIQINKISVARFLQVNAVKADKINDIQSLAFKLKRQIRNV